jgi:hypothetical protein
MFRTDPTYNLLLNNADEAGDGRTYSAGRLFAAQ